MFEIIEIIDEDFDHYETYSIEEIIKEDPNHDYSWLPLDRWADRKVTL